MTFGAPRIDAAVARELLRAVKPLAIEAAFEAQRMHQERQEQRRHVRDMDLRQARYEAGLAERRYTACDPDNRLIAAQLEKDWKTALRRVRKLELPEPVEAATDIEVAPGTFADVDDAVRDVVLTIHWRGGHHSELRVRKPRSGEHGCATTNDALAVMRSIAGRWSDEHIAAPLNRMGLPTTSRTASALVKGEKHPYRWRYRKAASRPDLRFRCRDYRASGALVAGTEILMGASPSIDHRVAVSRFSLRHRLIRWEVRQLAPRLREGNLYHATCTALIVPTLSKVLRRGPRVSSC